MSRNNRCVDGINQSIAVQVECATLAFDIRLDFKRIEAGISSARGQRGAADTQGVPRQHHTIINRIRASAVKRTGADRTNSIRHEGKRN